MNLFLYHNRLFYFIQIQLNLKLFDFSRSENCNFFYRRRSITHAHGARSPMAGDHRHRLIDQARKGTGKTTLLQHRRIRSRSIHPKSPRLVANNQSIDRDPSSAHAPALPRHGRPGTHSARAVYGGSPVGSLVKRQCSRYHVVPINPRMHGTYALGMASVGSPRCLAMATATVMELWGRDSFIALTSHLLRRLVKALFSFGREKKKYFFQKRVL